MVSRLQNFNNFCEGSLQWNSGAKGPLPAIPQHLDSWPNMLGNIWAQWFRGPLRSFWPIPHSVWGGSDRDWTWILHMAKPGAISLVSFLIVFIYAAAAGCTIMKMYLILWNNTLRNSYYLDQKGNSKGCSTSFHAGGHGFDPRHHSIPRALTRNDPWAPSQ